MFFVVGVPLWLGIMLWIFQGINASAAKHRERQIWSAMTKEERELQMALAALNPEQRHLLSLESKRQSDAAISAQWDPGRAFRG